jgi:hypothetical protein
VRRGLQGRRKREKEGGCKTTLHVYKLVYVFKLCECEPRPSPAGVVLKIESKKGKRGGDAKGNDEEIELLSLSGRLQPAASSLYGNSTASCSLSICQYS